MTTDVHLTTYCTAQCSSWLFQVTEFVENKSVRFLPTTWARYNITDKHLFM